MKLNIGKNGLTDGTITSLHNAFKTHKSLRISVLQNYAPDKEKVCELAEQIVLRLGKGYKYTRVGFTIIMRKAKGAR